MRVDRADVGSRFMPIGSTDLSPLPDVFVYGFVGGAVGVPSLSTDSVVRVAARLVQILERVGRAGLEVLRGQQQERVAARVERAEEVDAGAGELELHPALAAGEVVRRDVGEPTPPGRTSLNMTGVLTSTW